MSADKPLPRPRRKSREPEGGLLADKMARAMAEGRFDEFVDKELKGNEGARRLAELMMHTTGMAPPAAGKQKRKQTPRKKIPPEQNATGKEKVATGEKPGAAASLKPGVMEELSRIAAENGVEVDWIISRALGLYIRDHRATGRL
ncbi:MAG: hypothetical protein IBX61_00110 [Thermoleophilia bacterium]|nr:hypothetical protein [Thermoleophilia bacterium]